MYLKCMISVLAISVATIAPDEAHAFGFGDIVSIGIQAVGKVGGAVIDKALEDSPEEKEAKRQKEKADREVQFHKEIAKIEERPDLSPLDKERLTRQVSNSFGLAETFSNLQAQQELQRIKQRDQVLTVGGIAGVVGNAALNSPSVIMERADMAARSGLPQAQARGAIERADMPWQKTAGKAIPRSRRSCKAAFSLAYHQELGDAWQSQLTGLLGNSLARSIRPWPQ